MRFIIDDDCFSYQVDWSRQDKVEDGFVEHYHPSVEESIEAFLRLLENIHPRKKIAECIESGIRYSGSQSRGVS